MGRNSLTQAELKRHLHYDPETGVFTRLCGSYRGKEAGHKHPSGYRRIEVNYWVYQANRLAWLYVHGRWPEEEIDHIDRDTFNDAIVNLREATKSQNCWNKLSNRLNKTGFKGVHAFGDKYRARICYNGKRISLGIYNTPEKAYEAYKEAARQYHGEFSPVRAWKLSSLRD